MPGALQQAAQVLCGRLRIGRVVFVWIVVVGDSEVRSSFGPDIIRFGWVNVSVVAALGGQHIVVVGGIGRVLADVHQLAIDVYIRCAGDETVDERRIGILKYLLNSAGDRGGLNPVVVFQGNDKHVLNLVIVLVVILIFGDREAAAYGCH